MRARERGENLDRTTHAANRCIPASRKSARSKDYESAGRRWQERRGRKEEAKFKKGNSAAEGHENKECRDVECRNPLGQSPSCNSQHDIFRPAYRPGANYEQHRRDY